MAAAALIGAGQAQAYLPGPYENAALGAPFLTGVTNLQCTLNSPGWKAVDGAWSNIYTDKWCVRNGSEAELIIQLPGGYEINKVVVRHAGVAGENPQYNTKAFRVDWSANLYSGWQNFATVTNNTANVSTLEVAQPVYYVRWMRLRIDIPTQTTNQAARIYEFEAWGRKYQY